MRGEAKSPWTACVCVCACECACAHVHMCNLKCKSQWEYAGKFPSYVLASSLFSQQSQNPQHPLLQYRNLAMTTGIYSTAQRFCWAEHPCRDHSSSLPSASPSTGPEVVRWQCWRRLFVKVISSKLFTDKAPGQRLGTWPHGVKSNSACLGFSSLLLPVLFSSLGVIERWSKVKSLSLHSTSRTTGMK